MPKFTGFLVTLSLDKSNYEKKLQDSIRRAVFRAWGEWLEVFIETIPVWSGQSLASARKLAEVLGKDIIISPAASAPDEIARGTAQGSAQVEEHRGSVHIIFKTTVKHLIINEYIDARIFGFKLKRPGPYDFIGKCRVAYLASIRKGIDFPDDIFEFTLIGLG